MKRLILALAALSLAACGKISPLQPPPGQPLPVRPLMATSTPDAEQLLTYRRKPSPNGSTNWSASRSAAQGRPLRPAAPRRRRRADARGRHADQLRRSRTRDPAMIKPIRKAVFPVAGPRHPPAPRDQGDAQGNADDRRSAADPICRRRGARGGDRADDLRHRPRQSGARGLFRHRLRARGDACAARARASMRSTVALRFRRDRRRPPATAARPRPCRLVRAPYRRRRAVRGTASRRSDGRQARRAEANGRRLCDARRQSRLHRGSAGRRHRQLRHHRPGRSEGASDRSPRPGRKAPARRRSVAARRDRPLHPPARSDAHPRRRRKGRRRRNPADRRAWPN